MPDTFPNLAFLKVVLSRMFFKISNRVIVLQQEELESTFAPALSLLLK